METPVSAMPVVAPLVLEVTICGDGPAVGRCGVVVELVIIQDFSGRLPTGSFPGPAVEGVRHDLELIWPPPGQVGAPGKVLAEKPVRVLVRPALSGTVRVREVDRDASVELELGVNAFIHPAGLPITLPPLRVLRRPVESTL